MHKVSRDRCSFLASMETIRELNEIGRQVALEETNLKDVLESLPTSKRKSSVKDKKKTAERKCSPDNQMDQLIPTYIMGKTVLDSSIDKTKKLIAWCKEKPQQNRMDQVRYQWSLTLLQIKVFQKRVKQNRD